jgi:hypothetical protein
MKMHFQAAGSVLVLLCSLGIHATAAALEVDSTSPVAQPTLSAEEVIDKLVRKNLERSQALSGFQGTRIYHLEYQGFPSSRKAEMVVDVKYQAPATKEFVIRSATGSNLLIDRVLKKLLQSEQEALTPENQSRVALNKDNYTFTLEKHETGPTGSFYIFSVEPHIANKLLYRGRIWVDDRDFAVVRIEASPAKNPSFWIKDTKIEHVYVKIADFWLPSSNRSTTTTRLGGHAYLTIDYKDYRVIAAPPSLHSSHDTHRPH